MYNPNPVETWLEMCPQYFARRSETIYLSFCLGLVIVSIGDSSYDDIPSTTLLPIDYVRVYLEGDSE